MFLLTKSVTYKQLRFHISHTQEHTLQPLCEHLGLHQKLWTQLDCTRKRVYYWTAKASPEIMQFQNKTFEIHCVRVILFPSNLASIAYLSAWCAQQTWSTAGEKACRLCDPVLATLGSYAITGRGHGPVKDFHCWGLLVDTYIFKLKDTNILELLSHTRPLICQETNWILCWLVALLYQPTQHNLKTWRCFVAV